MEGTHTVLRLYKPVQELCFISLYFPTKKSRGFSRAGQTPREVRPQDEDAKQRDQYDCDGTKAAIAQLAAEHHQLLTDLLSLCSDCADRIKMGNQDGKLQDRYGEHLNSTISPSSEHKRAASRVRKLKSAEKLKINVQSGASEFSPKAISTHGIDTPGSGSNVSVSSEVCGWDFMEEPRSFESEMDLCAELLEFDNQLTLGYKNQHGCVQPEIMTNGNIEGSQSSQRDVRINDMATKQSHTASKEEPVPHSSLDHQQAGQEEIKCFIHEKTFSPSIDALRPWSRSPTSSSLSGVFNVSYPPANSLQSMSPVLSPLSSQLPSPPMNHRIVLLPEEDDGNKRSSRDEPKAATEVIDKNGNRRTITRLDLNLSSHFYLNGASTSSATASGKKLLF